MVYVTKDNTYYKDYDDCVLNKPLNGYYEWGPEEDDFAMVSGAYYKATFLNGKLHGTLIKEDIRFSMAYVCEYHMGLKNGLECEYALCQVRKEGYWDNKRNVPFDCEYTKDMVKEISHWHMGRRNGLFAKKNNEGELHYFENYKEGKKHGLCKNFDFLHDLYQMGCYIDGLKHGMFAYWHQRSNDLGVTEHILSSACWNYGIRYYKGELVKDAESFDCVCDMKQDEWCEYGGRLMDGVYEEMNSGGIRSLVRYKNGQIHGISEELIEDGIISYYWKNELIEKEEWDFHQLEEACHETLG